MAKQIQFGVLEEDLHKRVNNCKLQLGLRLGKIPSNKVLLERMIELMEADLGLVKK